MITRTLFIAFVLATSGSRAQDGTFDPTFNPTDQGMARFDGVDESQIHCMLAQPDGKLLVGGWHDGGALAIEDPLFRGGILRLNADGSPDAGFAVGTGFDGPVEVIVLQPDGKILVGGAFLNFNGTPRKGIARLNATGTLDASFNVGTGTGGTVFEIAPQADGRILLGGNFTTYNALPANRIVRLLSDGSYDPSFSAGLGFNDNVVALSLQVDGKVLAGGSFTMVHGIPKNYLARLNADGSPDLVFNDNTVQTGPNGAVTDIATGTAGTAFIAGVFTQFNGAISKPVVKVDGNGAPVSAFNMGESETALTFHAERLHYDQPTNVLTAWSYADLRKVDGSTGGTLHGWSSFNEWYYQLYCWSLGGVAKASVAPGGGMFVAVGNSILRLNSDLSHDGLFRPGSGLPDLPSGVCMALDDLGRPVIGHRNGAWPGFTAFNGAFHPNLVGLEYDGAYNAGFPKKGYNHGIIRDIKAYGIDTLLVSGEFTFVCPDGGIGAPMFLLKASTGSLTPVYPGADVHEVLRMTSGHTIYAGQTQVGRLLPDAIVDAAYLTTVLGPTPSEAIPQCLAAAPDGKAYVGGDFTMANGLTRNRIVRVLANGGVDPSFDPLAGFDNDVREIIVNPDGSIVCIGDFTTYRGSPAPHIAKLLPDASMDPSFDPGTGIANTPMCMLRYPDGRILIGGAIPMYDGNVVNGIVCINADGSIDETFDQGEGFRLNNPTINGGTPGGGWVVDMEMQPDGKVVCLGEFHMYDGNGRNRVARIGSGASVLLMARVLLEGPYAGNGGMTASLGAPLIPLQEPYSALGYPRFGGGSESISPAVLLQQGPQAVVDWIRVELRNSNDPSEIVATRSGLLLANGSIVDTDGQSMLRFWGTPEGLYYVAVRYRNHLGAMTATPTYLGISPFQLDFGSTFLPLYGTDAMKVDGNDRMLWAGDVDHDGSLRYIGQDNDRDPILVAIGGSVPTSTVSGYKLEDVNLDGVVRYIGQDNDRDPILVNIGGSVPTNVRQEQLP